LQFYAVDEVLDEDCVASMAKIDGLTVIIHSQNLSPILFLFSLLSFASTFD